MRNRLLTTTIVLALLLALASLPAFAAKVDVCHIPPGNPDNWHTISVSTNALAAHLGHDDLEGSCAENCETLCDDFDACTQDIESDYEQCICSAEPRPAVDCNDSNPCTVDGCNSEFGCTYDATAADGNACDDGDPDTSDDVCTDGVCAGTAGGCPCGQDPNWAAVADGLAGTCKTNELPAWIAVNVGSVGNPPLPGYSNRDSWAIVAAPGVLADGYACAAGYWSGLETTILVEFAASDAAYEACLTEVSDAAGALGGCA